MWLKIKAVLAKITDVLMMGRSAGLWSIDPEGKSIPRKESSLGK